MARYEIVHIDNQWIVCVEQAGLISFDRKWKAMKAMQGAARLAHEVAREHNPDRLSIDALGSGCANKIKSE